MQLTRPPWAKGGMDYYNENDPVAAEWLRQLSGYGHIPRGVVDERSIVEVRGRDIGRHTQSHFFAGIGGWALALKLAGWPEGRQVWTGSCPCQPFSSAGKRGGDSDPRHLWPVFRRIIAECRPPTVFGEQVAGKDGLLWLAGVRTDLEALGYAVGSADLCSAGVGSPNIRQRLFWVADLNGGNPGKREYGQQPVDNMVGGGWGKKGVRGVGNPHPAGRARRELPGGERAGGKSFGTASGEARSTAWDRYDAVHCQDGHTRRFEPGSFPLADGVPGRLDLLRGYGNAINPHVAAAFIAAFLGAEADLT